MYASSGCSSKVHGHSLCWNTFPPSQEAETKFPGNLRRVCYAHSTFCLDEPSHEVFEYEPVEAALLLASEAVREPSFPVTVIAGEMATR